MIVDHAKLIVIVLVTMCATVLLTLGRIDATVWIAIVGPFGGYAVGNGVTVGTGNRPTTLLSRADIRTRATDQPPPIDLTAWSETTPDQPPPPARTLRPSDHGPPQGHRP